MIKSFLQLLLLIGVHNEKDIIITVCMCFIINSVVVIRKLQALKNHMLLKRIQLMNIKMF